MLHYSKETLFSLPKLFAYRNEINIFTEDNIEDKEFYRVLLSRLSEKTRKKVCDITPLGSKTNVLEAFERNKNDQKKSIYIVDGDICVLLNSNPKNTTRLVYLDRYCIENYLFCENAALELAYMISYSSDKETLKRRLNFSRYYDPYIKPVIDIYILFAISYKYDIGIEFTPLPCFWGKNKDNCISNIASKIHEIEVTIKQFLSDNGFDADNTLEKEKADILRLWPYTFETFYKAISGKDYLLHLLRDHISFATDGKKVTLQREAFKLFLVNNCSLESLDFLKKVIEEI